KTYPVRKQVLVALRREEKALKKLTQHISNRSFISLQSMRDNYYAGKVSGEKFARALVRQAERQGLGSTHYVQVLKNLSTVSSGEMDIAFSEVYTWVSERLAKARPMTSFLRHSLGNEEDIRQNIAVL